MRAEKPPAPAIPSSNRTSPIAANAGQSGSPEVPSPAEVYPKRKGSRGRFTKEQAAHAKPYELDIRDRSPEARLHKVRGRRKVREKRETGRDTPTIRYEIPSVAKHVARVVVMHSMDYAEAVRYLLGARAQEINVSDLAERIENSLLVQKFIDEDLHIHGLDDASKESYLQEMWSWLRHGSENKAMKAAGILGRGFVAEKVETVKPESLPIEGLGDAVRSMLGTKETTDDIEKSDAGDARGSVRDAKSKKPPEDK